VRLCETTNQAMTPRFRKTAITTQLMRCSFAQAVLEDRHGIIISVSPSHVGFYELLGFHKSSDVRSYSRRHHDPVVMMCQYPAELERKDPAAGPCERFVADYLFFKNPFMGKVRQWKRLAQAVFHEPVQLRSVFVEESELLKTCTDADREGIRNHWGEGLYVSVLNGRQGRHTPRQVGAVRG